LNKIPVENGTYKMKVKSTLKMINESFWEMLYFSFNIYSNSPKYIDDIFL
jgi:hypothetical protein